MRNEGIERLLDTRYVRQLDPSKILQIVRGRVPRSRAEIARLMELGATAVLKL